MISLFCTFAYMTLHDDIYDFLNGKGLYCRITTLNGHPYLSCITCNGRTVSILPIKMEAPGRSDAVTASDSASQAIKNLTSLTGGYPLIIAEDRWRKQNDMMKARLLAHLEVFDQIYARNCEVRKIDRQTAADFLTASHSYGDASCRHRYGLFLKRHTGHIVSERKESVRYPAGTLVAVATFSNARKWTKGDKTIRSYEWTRYASLPGVRLSGGMGKLLKAFIEDVHPDDIMTYADLEWSEGKVYERLGFVLEGVKAPVTFSVDTVSWDRHAIKEQDMPSGHCPVIQSIMTNELVYFRNFGSNKYRFKLTDYQ